MRKKIFEAFQDVFSISSDTDTKELIYNEYSGWDSVGHMTLVAALEEKFDLMFDMDDILDMSSFDKIEKIVMRAINVA